MRCWLAKLYLRRHLDGKMVVISKHQQPVKSQPRYKLGAMIALVRLPICCMPVKLHLPTDAMGLCDK